MSAGSQAKIASLVRETRQQLQLTQPQSARELEVSDQNLNRWGDGRNLPLPAGLKLIEAMLRQMSVSVAYRRYRRKDLREISFEERRDR